MREHERGGPRSGRDRKQHAFREVLLACCCVVLIAFIAIAVKGRNGNLKHFKVARVRRGIPILGGLVILTIVRIIVNH